jgi:hypothetical protein
VTLGETAQGLVQRLVESAPLAWRHDPIFRGATIGAGVTLALLLFRMAGPHAPELEPPMLRPTPSASLSRRGGPALEGKSLPSLPPAEVPKIAPGHGLGDVMVVPTPDGDHFGTFTPGKHP